MGFKTQREGEPGNSETDRRRRMRERFLAYKVSKLRFGIFRGKCRKFFFSVFLTLRLKKQMLPN